MGRASTLDNKDFNLEEDQDSRFSNTQKDKVLKGEQNAAETIASQKAFENIYKGARKDLLKSGTVLSEEERKAFQEKLMIANQERDPKKLAEIQKHITETIDQTHNLTQQYFKGLDLNKDLFGKDTSRNLDTLQEYKDEFAKQNLKNKKEWHNKLGEEVKSLKDIRDQLIQTVGSGKEAQAYMDQFNKLRRSEKREYLKEVKGTVESFTKAVESFRKSGLYSDEEIKHLSVKFRESPLDQQKKMLADLEADAKSDSIKSVQDTFKKFSPENQKKFEQTLKKARGLKAKKEVIENMKQGLRDELIKLTQNSKYQSPEEKSQVLSIEKEERPEVLEMFVKGFPAAEKKLMEFGKAYESAPVNVQAQYDFWNAHYGNKEKIAEDCKKHVEKIGQANKKIDEKVKGRLLSPASAAKYKTRFEKLSLKEKDAALKQSTLDDPRRAANLQRFENTNKIPKAIQEKHKQFYNMRLEDRIKLVNELEGTIDKKVFLRQEFEKKLDDLVEQQLLSPLSVDSLTKTFEEIDDVDQMKSELEKSNLDDPGRRKVLDTFKELPDDVRKKHEQLFYNQDQVDRIETLKMLLPDGGADLERALSSMEGARQLTDKLQQETELKTYRNLAQEFRAKNNQKAEMEMREKISKLEPEDELNKERLEELKMLENPDSQFIGEMLMQVKGEAGMKEEIEANHVMFEIADRAHAHELHSKKLGMERRVAANDNQEFSELSQEIYEYSEGKQMLDRTTGKAIDMQVFDENEIFKSKNVVKINEHRKRFKKDGENFTDSAARLGQYGMRDHTGKELKGEELLRYKRQKATVLAAKILHMGTEGQITGTPSDEVVEEMLKAIDEIDDFRNAA